MFETRIIDLLGKRALLLPALLSTAIAATERAKYLLAADSLLRAPLTLRDRVLGQVMFDQD